MLTSMNNNLPVVSVRMCMCVCVCDVLSRLVLVCVVTSPNCMGQTGSHLFNAKFP